VTAVNSSVKLKRPQNTLARVVTNIMSTWSHYPNYPLPHYRLPVRYRIEYKKPSCRYDSRPYCLTADYL